MINHPGQWLFEEGLALYWGLDFKKMDMKRGQLIIEASASAGFPMAVAYCHLTGWNGMKKGEHIVSVLISRRRTKSVVD